MKYVLVRMQDDLIGIDEVVGIFSNYSQVIEKLIEKVDDDFGNKCYIVLTDEDLEKLGEMVGR